MKTNLRVFVPLTMIAVIALFGLPSGASAQAVVCPAGFICRPINPTGTINPSTLPPASCHAYSADLTIGSRGNDISDLQTFLINNGFDIPSISRNVTVKGYFGSQTSIALKSYQANNGIPSTGYFGAMTRAMMNRSCWTPPVNPIPVSPTPVNPTTPVAPPCCKNPPVSTGYHSADTNHDWRIDASELSYFQTLYDYRSGTVRTGEYNVNFYTTNSIPGNSGIVYSPGPGSQSGPTHSADTNKDWHISLTELMRVIELYNSPGGYMIQPGTEDGFAPVLTGTTPTPPQPRALFNVLSPNGGETWTSGTIQSIRWQDNSPRPVYGAPCNYDSSTGVGSCPGFAAVTYDIHLMPYRTPCTGYCPMLYMMVDYTIASAVSGSSFDWTVGRVNWASVAPEGSYMVQVCQTGTDVCDSSDSYFKIGSGGVSTNQPPVITGITAPTMLDVNQTGTWSVNAYDPENGSLSYSVDWGDQPLYTSSPTSGALVSVTQTSTFTHSYATAGTYKVSFTVRDNTGLTAQSSATVQVGSLNRTGYTVPLPVSISGNLQGMATINQTINQTCPAPVSNSTFGIKIYQGADAIRNMKFNSDGSFSTNLTAGTYMVYPDSYPDHMDGYMLVSPNMWGNSLPRQITIQNGLTTNLNISGFYACNAL